MVKMVREGGRRAKAILIVAALSMASVPFTVAAPAGASTSPAPTLAQRLLDEAVIPTDAVVAHPVTAVVCQCAGAPDVAALTTRHQYYVVPGSPGALESFLTRHLPVGGSFDGSVGTSSSSNGSEVKSIAITFRAIGPHLYLKQLAYSITQRTSSTSWLRIDSQIVWVPSRTQSETVSNPVSATVTGYERTALSGNSGDVRINLSGRTLAKLINEFNTLPLGPTNLCMENLGGFSMSLTLKSGEHVQIFNGFCGGSFDEVSSPTSNLNGARYEVSDHSCGFMRAVVSLFATTTAAGTREALHQCEVWSKASDS
jgi:hypothetical protein